MKNFKRTFFAKAAALLVLLCGAMSNGKAQTTTYTPGAYTTVVPAGVTSMQVTVTGAAGGTYFGAVGGNGGRVTATYTVVPGTTYYIFVGSEAANSLGSNGGSSYGGGEDGGKGGAGGSSSGIGGGAASDVRTSIAGGASTVASLNSRIVVGGGGGGAGCQGCTGNSAGGNGGNPSGTGGALGGCTSCTSTVAGGGTQSAGGARGGTGACATNQAGGFGVGGTGGTGTGAGGGGWYGGGGAYSGGGGGGSSYASTTGIIGTATFTNGVNTGDGEVIICFSPSAITGPSTVCPGGTIALTDITPGGTWSSSATGIATVESTTGIVHGVSGGTAVISYSTGSCPAVMNVTVSALGAITGTALVCVGSTTNLSSTTAGGVWSSDNTSIATVAGGVVGGVAVGSANISYTVGSCAVGVPVTVSGAVAAITGPTAVCGGATIALTNTTTGGTWSSGSTSIATVTNLGIVTGVATGSATISYTSGACVATHVVNVTAVGPVTGPVLSVCAGSSITLSSGTGAGGAWSSDNTPVATVAGGTVSGVSAGTANISYTIGSCSASAAVTVTAGLSAITGPTAVCVGSTITLSNATAGGTWSSSSTSNATIGSGTGVAGGVAAGTTNISYFAGGCSIGMVLTVGVLSPIIGPSALCPGATTTLSNATTGGTWSSSNTAVATVDPVTGVVTGLAGGPVTISYTNGTCSVDLAILLGPLPAITGSTTICPSTSSPLSNTTPGGVWTSDNTAVATVSATGVVTGVAAGTANISYTTGPCAVGVMVTVGALPGITGPTTVCPGGTITLNNTTTGGTWSSSNTARATVDATTGVVTGVAAGAVTISYAAGGCSVGYPITVGPLSAISGATTLCAGSTVTLSHATTGGVWSSGSTATATVDPVTGIVTGAASGSVNITYTVGSCNVSIALTVSGALTPITGTAATCVGSTTMLSNATAGGTWSSDNTPVATVNAVGAVTGVSNGTANISYTVGTCSVGISVTINTLPAITGSTNVCAGSVISLSNTVPGGVWSSGNPAAATVAATGVVTGVASGSATISYTVSSCSVSVLVTVGSAVAAITGPNVVCTGQTIGLSDATPGGAWSSSNGGVAAVSTTGVVSGVAQGSTTISYTIGGCSASLGITVNASNAGVITGADSVCKGVGHQVVLSSSVSGGTWSSSNTTRATVDPVTGEVSGNQTGTVTIRYVVSNSCGTFTVSHVMYVRSPSKCNLGVDPAAGTISGELKIFPNPNGGIFTANVVSEFDEEVHIVVTNIVGEKVKEFTAATNKAVSIKLNYAPGIYLITASTAHERYVSKVTIQ